MAHHRKPKSMSKLVREALGLPEIERPVYPTTASDPLERVRRICLGLPGAWEKLSHGEPTFWVGKRMFAMLANAGNHHGAGRHAVWCKGAFVTAGLPDPRVAGSLFQAAVRERGVRY